MVSSLSFNLRVVTCLSNNHFADVSKMVKKHSLSQTASNDLGFGLADQHVSPDFDVQLAPVEQIAVSILLTAAVSVEVLGNRIGAGRRLDNQMTVELILAMLDPQNNQSLLHRR
jgi:hypothetical protein